MRRAVRTELDKIQWGTMIYLCTVGPPKAGLIHEESEGGWTSLAEAQYLLGRPCQPTEKTLGDKRRESLLKRDLRGNSEKMRGGEQRGVEQIKTGKIEKRLGRTRNG